MDNLAEGNSGGPEGGAGATELPPVALYTLQQEISLNNKGKKWEQKTPDAGNSAY